MITAWTDAMPGTKPVVFVTRRLPDAVEERLRRDYAPRLNRGDRPYGAGELVERSAGAAAILTCATEAWPAALIERLPDCVRAIATFSAGHEHIELAAARARGIIVTNTPDVLTEGTADVAMLCLLGAARRAFEGQALVRARKWRGWTPTQLLGIELHGATLGIVGMGRIGQAVARRARAFGMDVHYHGRRRLPPDRELDAVFHPTLQILLPACRFLSLHCPATAATARMINTETLALLPPGAVLINTARGILLDDEAVLAALDSGRLFALGLDVYDGEPDLHPGYRARRNCFLLPHLGSATVETRNAMGFAASTTWTRSSPAGPRPMPPPSVFSIGSRQPAPLATTPRYDRRVVGERSGPGPGSTRGEWSGRHFSQRAARVSWARRGPRFSGAPDLASREDCSRKIAKGGRPPISDWFGQCLRDAG